MFLKYSLPIVVNIFNLHLVQFLQYICNQRLNRRPRIKLFIGIFIQINSVHQNVAKEDIYQATSFIVYDNIEHNLDSLVQVLLEW